MHFVRIHAKPRAQHGSLSTTDQNDPAAVAVRRAHGTSVSSTRLTSPLWRYLPFTRGVSRHLIDLLSLLIILWS